LQLLLAEDDNINRSVKIRGGLYTARAKEGRYVGTTAPFGYYKLGERKERKLYIDEEQAKVIRFIYDAFLRNAPLKLIRDEAIKMGFTKKGNCSIERVLKSPIYAGMLYTQGYKDSPGGNFPAFHDAIIDMETWQMVQCKLEKPKEVRNAFDENLPLRGILRCHCGTPLTGAPSKGKTGQIFYYYKCKHSKHLNLSAKKAHIQLNEILELMSFSEDRIANIRKKCKNSIDIKLKSDKQELIQRKNELVEAERDMISLEEKWIKNQINRETYERWHSSYNCKTLTAKSAIARLSKSDLKIEQLLERNIDNL
jgi:hypothetical protein